MSRTFVVTCEFERGNFKMTGQINEKPPVLICQSDRNMVRELIWPKIADLCSEYFDTKLRCMGNRVEPEAGSDWYNARERR